MRWFKKKTSCFLESFSPFTTPWRYDALVEEGYHKNVVVYRCVNLISRAMASVPWILWDMKEERYNSHFLLNLLHTSFTEHMIGYLLLSGNAFIEITNSLRLIRPDQVYVYAKNDMRAYEIVEEGKKRRIPLHVKLDEPSMIHIKLFHPLSEIYGMSPLEAASSAIDQHNAVGMHNLALLQNGGRSSSILKQS